MSAPVRRILLVNPNTNAATTAMMVEAARGAVAEVGQDATVHGVTAATGPAMIIDPAALADAVAPTVAAGRAGVDAYAAEAVIVAAFGDPGIAELRAAVQVPVLGIGETALRAAAGRRVPFAIVTSTPRLHAPLSGLVAAHCPDGNFVGIFYADGDPVELAPDPDRNVAALDAAIDAALAAGAQCVVIGGGPLTGAARQLASRTDVAVIEPVPCAVRSALSVLDHAMQC